MELPFHAPVYRRPFDDHADGHAYQDAGMTATQAGSPMATMAGMVEHEQRGPTMMKSPWAKLISRMMLETMV